MPSRQRWRAQLRDSRDAVAAAAAAWPLAAGCGFDEDALLASTMGLIKAVLACERPASCFLVRW